MRELFRNASPTARALLIVGVLFLATMCVSLSKRAYRGDSDFGVFYRAGVSLAQGAGGEIYAERDRPTGWYNCIPPSGMGIFIALAYVYPVAAGVIWATVNVGLLYLSFVFLKAINSKLTSERIHYDQTLPFVVVMLCVFGGVCIQTGQTSILFVTCWIGYIYATQRNRSSLGGMLLAIPASLKLYPILFAFVPAVKRKYKELAWGVIGCTLLSAFLPALIFREHFFDLTQSFVVNQVLDPGGRVMTSADPTAVSNQGIDAVLLRYLAYVPSFHDNWQLPHLNFDKHLVVSLANFLRLLIVSVTAWMSIKWLRDDDTPSLALMALWCAALYVMLPGAKSRYAIYALPAFIVLIAQCHSAWFNGHKQKARNLCACILVSAILLLQLVPDYFLQFGIGLFGSALLWATTLVLTPQMSVKESPRGAGKNDAARSERTADVL